jgi:hypothetical protein
MHPLSQRFGGVIAAVLLVGLASQADAGPGDDDDPGGGSVVVSDRPEAPSLSIQEVRELNADATHVPVKARLSIPGGGLRWAELTAYLTSAEAADAPRLAEATVEIGPQWANRAVIIEVPSPGEGDYFLHVEGELHLEDHELLEVLTQTVQPVNFGKTLACQRVESVAIPNVDQPCPLLFDNKSTELTPRKDGQLSAENRKVLAAATRTIQELCESDSLHRVSVHGWASTLHSVNPTNEELARDRASATANALVAAVPKCKGLIHIDSVRGTRAVTTQFGDPETADEKNRCAQIEITRYACGG